MYLRKLGTFTGLVIATLLGITSMAQGTSVPPGGGSTLPSADVTLTDTSLSTNGLPSLSSGSTFDTSNDALTGSLIPNGFSTSGTLSFTTPSSSTFSGSESLSYTIQQSISLTPGFYMVYSYANGTFSASSGSISGYSVTTTLYDSTRNSSIIAVAEGSTLSTSPLALSNTDQTLSYLGYSPIMGVDQSASADSFYLIQSLTVDFTGLNSGTDVYVNFPNDSGFVPEPSSLTLLGIGVCGLMGYSCKRRKYQRGNASLLALA